MKNAFVFGDVHGDYTRLELLIAKVRALLPGIALFSVGDLIDRGPSSKGVLEVCVREGVKGVLGNHELWFHQLASMGTFQHYALDRIMGGAATLRSYGVDPTDLDEEEIGSALSMAVPQSHKDFVLGLPAHLKIVVAGQTYRLIHAGLKHFGNFGDLADKGIPEDKLLAEVIHTKPEVLLWTAPSGIKRDGDESNLYRFRDGSIQIFGHVPLSMARDGGHWIGLDTGCGTCPPYKLTGVLLSEDPLLNRMFLSA